MTIPSLAILLRNLFEYVFKARNGPLPVTICSFSDAI